MLVLAQTLWGQLLYLAWQSNYHFPSLQGWICLLSHDGFLLVIRTFCPLVFRTYFCVDIYKVCVRLSWGTEWEKERGKGKGDHYIQFNDDNFLTFTTSGSKRQQICVFCLHAHWSRWHEEILLAAMVIYYLNDFIACQIKEKFSLWCRTLSSSSYSLWGIYFQIGGIGRNSGLP